MGPGCRKHGTCVALPNLPNLVEKNLAILGDRATFRLILRSLPTHDEIVWKYLWVIAVDLYVYCGFLLHLNALGVLKCWNSGRKLPRAVGSLMSTVSCHNLPQPWLLVKCSNISNTFQPLDAVHDSRIWNMITLLTKQEKWHGLAVPQKPGGSEIWENY